MASANSKQTIAQASSNNNVDGESLESIAKQILDVLNRIEQNGNQTVEMLKAVDWKLWINLRAQGVIDDKNEPVLPKKGVTTRKRPDIIMNKN